MLSISLLLVMVMVSSCTCQIKTHYGAQDYEMSAWTMTNIPPDSPVQVYHHPYYYIDQPPPAPTTTTTVRPPPMKYYGNYYNPPQQLYNPTSAPVSPPTTTTTTTVRPLPVNNVQYYRNYYSPPPQLYHPTPVPVPVPVRVSYSDNAPNKKPTLQQQSPPAPIIPIIQFDQEMKEGEFNRFHFISANGIEEEQETIIQKYPESPASNSHNYGPNVPGNGYNNDYNNRDGHPGCQLIKRGKFSYYSPEGQFVQMQWIADSNGFQPQSSHISTSDPIPIPIPSQPHQSNYY